MKTILKLLLACACLFAAPCFAMENAFYVLRSDAPDQISSTEQSLASLQQHYKAINLLISQAYQVDAHGVVWGFVDPAVLAFANQHQIKLMVMITNADFDQATTQKFLADRSAQTTALQTILNVCQQHHYYGVQFDFEMVPLAERDALTQFYVMAANTLHRNGYAVSFAVAPVVGDNPQASTFLKKLYENWEGAYDLKALGKAGDFISIMAYNQHGEGTPPGPTASLPWVETIIKYALQSVPAAKISLGIPTYSSYWYTGSSASSRINVQLAGISYNQVNYLLQRNHAKLLWDDQDKVHYTVYEHDWLNEYLFVEDAQSFQAKYALAQKYHLRGISAFDLGIEDPKIWLQLIQSRLD